MSKLKKQLEVILPMLSEEANHNRDPDVKFRLYALKAIVESKKDVKKACEMRGVSTDFFYEWGGRLLRSRKLLSLKSRSRKPKHSPSQTPARVEKKIRHLRVAEPAHGSDRISFYLMRLFDIKCTPSAVYNVLGRLGFINKLARKKRSKKHMRRYTRPFPGYVQMDIKYVPFMVEGVQFYEFNAVDHNSSWRLIRAYRNKNYENLVLFLDELEKECPFALIQIQTDNGKEFTDKYRLNTDGKPTGWHPLDLWCAKHDIEHKLIPIGVKELNGKVENTHGFDDREFYSRYQQGFKTYESLELNMRSWNERWNGSRHTEKLCWRTPNEVIAASYVGYLVFWLNWCEQHQPVAKLSNVGIFELPLPPSLPARKIKKSKRKSFVDRYLTWMDGEEKKSLKSIIAVPAMSQILSTDSLCQPIHYDSL